MNQENKWAFIINPSAGNGFAATLENEIREMASRFKIGADITFSKRKGHAGELSAQYASSGFKYIIGVGGDGTFNEIAAPLINKKSVVTGLIPAGTGNDFIQILGFPGRFNTNDWEKFFETKTISIDAGSCNGMVFFNGMGLGFDAAVAAENYIAPGEVKKGGKNKYIWHILKTILFYKEKRMITVNGNDTTETDCFINTVANGRRFAGGFFLTPEATANDGLLDVCMVKKISVPERLSILTMVPKGSHIRDRRVTYYQTSGLLLRFKEEVPFHLDGELYFSREFEITIMPSALNVIYNNAGDHYLKIR